MLNGDGNENGKIKQKLVGVIGPQKIFSARAAHFFVHFFAVVVVT